MCNSNCNYDKYNKNVLGRTVKVWTNSLWWISKVKKVNSMPRFTFSPLSDSSWSIPLGTNAYQINMTVGNMVSSLACERNLYSNIFEQHYWAITHILLIYPLKDNSFFSKFIGLWNYHHDLILYFLFPHKKLNTHKQSLLTPSPTLSHHNLLSVPM